MNKYFNMTDKVYDVTEKYPELIDLFASKGFENLRNDFMRKTIGKTISVELALKSKHIDTESFEKEMLAIIEDKERAKDFSTGLEAVKVHSEDALYSVSGVLPCPIKMQIIEKMNSFVSAQDYKVNLDLQAATMGLGDIKTVIENSKSVDELDDVYMSAGFELFFDKKLMGRYMEDGSFSDITGVEHINEVFENDYIDLRDPKKRYTIIGVVPAIFMVNKEVLGDREYPRSWEDLLKPEFENSVSLPVRDLDLFNAIMLGMNSMYGREGVEKLGKALLSSMHPAQMVKNTNKSGGVAVTIMPYFFTWMAKEGGPLELVWPKEGAIISPIFLLTKTKSKDKIKPLVDFIFSSEMGEVLAGEGKFPTTVRGIDNKLSKDQKFVWAGWDYLHNNDIGEELKELEKIFFAAQGGK